MGVAWLVLALSVGGCDRVVTPLTDLTPAPEETSGLIRATPTLAPEIYLSPIPPTPTFTPSPTPTPVMHVVEQGDTLFGISIEYGVTVNGLLQANGLNESDFLRIGQALIIPLDDEESTESSAPMPADQMILPTPTPLPLLTDGVALYETPVGGNLCMGEVVNTFDEPVTNLQVEVSLLAPDERQLATRVTLAAADYLRKDERAPFSILFADPPEGVVEAQVRVRRAEAIGPITAGFIPLDVADARGAPSGPQYRVQGAAVNMSDQTVSRVMVVTTLYNAKGQVIGYRQEGAGAERTFAPGEAWDFDILLTPQGLEPPSNFRVIALAVP